MSVFDIVAGGIIGFFAFNGLRKGLISELFKILGVIAGLIIGLQTISISAAFVHQFISIGTNGEKALGFILVFIGIMLISLIVAHFVKNIFKWVMLGWLDRSGGTLLGGVKGALIISSVIPLLSILPDSIPQVKEIRRNSLAYQYLNGFAPKVYNTVGTLIPGSKSFAAKLKESFPSMKSLTKISGPAGTGAQEASMKQIQGLLGGNDNPTLDAVKKQLEDIGGMENLEETNLKNFDLQKAQEFINPDGSPKKSGKGRKRNN